MPNYFIFHQYSGKHLLTVQNRDDREFHARLDKGIPELDGKIFLKVFTDNEDSTFPHINRREDPAAHADGVVRATITDI